MTRIRVDGRAGNVYVFDDRLVVATDAGERVIPMAEVERVASRRTWRGARLLVGLAGAEVLQIRGLGGSATSVAHRTIVDLARRRH